MLWWVEVPAITRCRVLIAIATPESLNEALELLVGYKEYSESVFNKLRTIETTVLQALTYFKLQNEDDALSALKYALGLAAEGEWFRPFIEVAEELNDLFLLLKKEGVEIDFIEHVLLGAKQMKKTKTIYSEVQEEKVIKHQKENLVLLTRRELDILDCISDGLRNQEIADKLHNSEQTIKKHIYNMFQKMNVRNRLSLVTRAKETGILKAD
jgi:LuxR family maltose regulon positive regulatory protein